MSKPFLSDEDLMYRVRADQRAHLETLIRRHARPLMTFIRHMLGHVKHDEDVFQDVFLAVWANRKRYRHPTSFRAWLFTIAANACRSRHRRHKVERAALAQLASSASNTATTPQPSQYIETNDLAVAMEKHIAALTEKQRTVVVLRTLSNLDYDEIARVIGTSPSAARVHMHNGLKELARRMNAAAVPPRTNMDNAASYGGSHS